MYNYVQFRVEDGPDGGFVEVKKRDASVQYKADSLFV
jgi:hypothetical protein